MPVVAGFPVFRRLLPRQRPNLSSVPFVRHCSFLASTLGPLLLGLFLPLLSSCRQRNPSEWVEDIAPWKESVVRSSDLSDAPQLLEGLYRREPDGWRWTKGRFRITLRTPPGTGATGGLLELRFVVPEVLLARHPRLTISALSAQTKQPLGETVVTAAGEHRLRLPVPKQLLLQPMAEFLFQVSPVYIDQSAENRELGLIFLSAGLLHP